MPVLSREAVLSQKKLKQEISRGPEWGGSINIQELSADEADAFESQFASVVKPSTNGDTPQTKSVQRFRAKIVVMAAIDDQGNRLFKDEDIATLGEMSRSAIDKLATVAMRLSGYSEDAKKKSLATKKILLQASLSDAATRCRSNDREVERNAEERMAREMYVEDPGGGCDASS